MTRSDFGRKGVEERKRWTTDEFNTRSVKRFCPVALYRGSRDEEERDDDVDEVDLVVVDEGTTMAIATANKESGIYGGNQSGRMM